MATPQLNFDENALDRDSVVYSIYSRLLNGMQAASHVEMPDYVSNPPHKQTVPGIDDLDSYGDWIIDIDKINEQIAQFGEIQIKNSAYMFAHSIGDVLGNGTVGGVSGGAYLLRSGDSMDGTLTALKGFEAGVGNRRVFQISTDAPSNTDWALVNGYFRATGDVEVQGVIIASAHGIVFGDESVIFIQNKALHIDYPATVFDNSVEFNSTLECGNFVVNNTGASWDGNQYYHAGNANSPEVNWVMQDGFVAGSLIAEGGIMSMGITQMFGGFAAVRNKNVYLSSRYDQGDAVTIELGADVELNHDYSFMFDSNKVLFETQRSTQPDIISIAAPGMILNLGDGSNNISTMRIALQSDLCTYDSVTNGAPTKIITKEGQGYFPNGLSAKTATSGSLVFSTYAKGAESGVVLHKNVRLNSDSGPMISGTGESVAINIPLANTGGYSTTTIFNDDTTSFLVGQEYRTYSVCFDSSADLFSFHLPVESSTFAIASNRYTTALYENRLFFGVGKFIEGVDGGMAWNGSADFTDDLYSYDKTRKNRNFINGFIGKGWAIEKDTFGDFHATFDNLTIRKKMRIYELEIQKTTATNGSLWVSNSCSGDEVIELN